MFSGDTIQDPWMRKKKKKESSVYQKEEKTRKLLLFRLWPYTFRKHAIVAAGLERPPTEGWRTTSSSRQDACPRCLTAIKSYSLRTAIFRACLDSCREMRGRHSRRGSSWLRWIRDVRNVLQHCPLVLITSFSFFEAATYWHVCFYI